MDTFFTSHLPVSTFEPAACADDGFRNRSVPRPAAPVLFSQCGLSHRQFGDLLLKHLYVHGQLNGDELAALLRLPWKVVDESLPILRNERVVESPNADGVLRPQTRLQLTEPGRVRARAAFEHCRYVGPAPVSLEAYRQQCAAQSLGEIACHVTLGDALGNLVVDPGVVESLGIAVCRGRAVLLHGPTGNGKTCLARAIGRYVGNTGDIYVPYAVAYDDGILAVYDPGIHTATDQGEVAGEISVSRSVDGRRGETSLPDLRWRRVRRPSVFLGTELSLELLDLPVEEGGSFHQAPLQIKANGGVLIIDDLGRQSVSLRDLVNRWLLPLETRSDFVNLSPGRKLRLPADALTVFTTNLEPREWGDEAFLRRVGSVVAIEPPTREQYLKIFGNACQRMQIACAASAAEFLYSRYYEVDRPPRASDPQDLLEAARAVCRFRNQELRLSQELLSELADRHFAGSYPI
jgi:hypothetical protein